MHLGEIAFAREHVGDTACMTGTITVDGHLHRTAVPIDAFVDEATTREGIREALERQANRLRR